MSPGKSNMQEYDAYFLGTTVCGVCIKSFWVLMEMPSGREFPGSFFFFFYCFFIILTRTGPQDHI